MPQDTLPIYRLASPKVDAHDIARRTWNFHDYYIRETAGASRLRVKSGTKVVEVHAASGGVWAADEAHLWNIDQKPDLPDAARAKQMAASFLTDAKLVPKLDGPAQFEMMVDSVGGSFAATEDVANRTCTKRQLDVQVNHSLRIINPHAGPIPIVGGGNKLKVTFGDKGMLTACSATWRPILSVALEAKVIPKAEVDAEFEKRLSRFKNLKYTSTLADYAAPAGKKQEFLYPVYVYQGTMSVGKETVPLRITTLPATTFGPPVTFERQLFKRLTSTRPKIPLIVNPALTEVTPTRRGVRTVNPFECGTSWIGESGGLSGSKNNAKGFIDGLTADGWLANFNWGDGNAWESDWRRNDDTWVDAADFVFYTGHANMNGWVLSNPDDTFLSTSEVGTMPASPGDLWGQQDLEWIIVAACGPLQDEVLAAGGGNVFDRWRGVFDGLHVFMGYGGITYDNEDEGKSVVGYAKGGTPIIDAWFRAAQDIQPSTNGAAAPDGPNIYVGAMYAYNSGTTSPRNDHLWGHGSVAPDPAAPTIRVCMWTQC